MNEVIASLASPVQASTKNCSKSGHEKKVENGSDEFPNNEVQIEREKDVVGIFLSLPNLTYYFWKKTSIFNSTAILTAIKTKVVQGSLEKLISCIWW